MDKKPATVKQIFEKKKYRKKLLRSVQKTESTHTSVSVYAERPQQVKRTKFEKELNEISGCFLGGYGSNTSHLEKLLQNYYKLSTFSIPKRPVSVNR